MNIALVLCSQKDSFVSVWYSEGMKQKNLLCITRGGSDMLPIR